MGKRGPLKVPDFAFHHPFGMVKRSRSGMNLNLSSNLPEPGQSFTKLAEPENMTARIVKLNIFHRILFPYCSRFYLMGHQMPMDLFDVRYKK